MTSELRPAVEVWRDAYDAFTDFYHHTTEKDPARVIEADREAVRAEQAAELAKFKALAETLAGALGEAVTWNSHDDEGVAAVWLDQADEALRQYKEARDER